MKVWAHEFCFCMYETGYQVQSLHRTKEQAKRALELAKHSRYSKGDGDRVRKWKVQGQ